MPDIRKERRLQRRFDLAEPVRARTGTTPVLIYDVSTRGLRIVHGSQVARVGETFLLIIDWHDRRIQLNCEVRRTEMKQTEGDSPRHVFESGLLITFADDPSMSAFQILIEAESRKALIQKSVSIAMPPHS